MFLELSLSFLELSWYNCLALAAMWAPAICSFYFFERVAYELWLQDGIRFKVEIVEFVIQILI
jgi:hypothetical protein